MWQCATRSDHTVESNQRWYFASNGSSTSSSSGNSSSSRFGCRWRRFGGKIWRRRRLYSCISGCGCGHCDCGESICASCSLHGYCWRLVRRDRADTSARDELLAHRQIGVIWVSHELGWRRRQRQLDECRRALSVCCRPRCGRHRRSCRWRRRFLRFGRLFRRGCWCRRCWRNRRSHDRRRGGRGWKLWHQRHQRARR